MLTNKLFLFFLFLCWNITSAAQVTLSGDDGAVLVGRSTSYLVSPDHNIGPLEVLNESGWTETTTDVLNFLVSKNSIWIRLPYQQTIPDKVWLSVPHSTLDNVTCFIIQDGRIIAQNELNDRVSPKYRFMDNIGYVFPLDIDEGLEATLLLKVESGDQVQVPIYLGTKDSIVKKYSDKNTVFALYLGIILAFFLMNLFIFITTKESSYFFYVIYLIQLVLTQAAYQGYTIYLLPSGFEYLERYLVYFFSATVGISAGLFMMNFLEIKKTYPKAVKIIYCFFLNYAIAVILAIAQQFQVAYLLLQITAGAWASYMIYVSVRLSLNGNRQARFFSLAWILFLISVVIFISKDFDILPYNVMTNNAMLVGSAIEGVLLSFALADKINVLKREKQIADAELLRAIKDQNEFLEIKVHERTEELEEARNKIQIQYDDLRLAQKQLVESEKMAGLGQMTAGIAHELNNPINFVSSNVAPLHRDVQDIISMLDDYVALGDHFSADDIARLKKKHQEIGLDFIKTEIEALLRGIEEGSRRTAEIVRGLRVFARSDKDELVQANINDCLQSTLVVVKSVTKGQVTLIKEFDTNMPTIYCYPGKLNQVIVNLVTNAVHATESPDRTYTDRLVTVKSYFSDKEVCISIKDNGHGIDEAIMEKIFIPFFTTKGVGEGTGLGLSISMGIVEEHKGHIEVLTEKNIGTEFIIHLPRLENARQDSIAGQYSV
jgi:two-component system NtrC family sensor kinase